MSKIIDTFLFNNEIQMLQTRLEYLGPHIDAFIINEANIDFSGKKKDYFLTPEILATLPFQEKIIYNKIDICLESLLWRWKKLKALGKKAKFLWKIQFFQRNAFVKFLRRFSPDDLVIFGDLDEFPDVSKLPVMQLSDETPAKSLEQLAFYYNLKTQGLGANRIWNCSIVTRVKYFESITPCRLRKLKDKLPSIKNGGWHFSYFMTPEKIREKVLAIAEVEKIDQYLSISEEEIAEKVANGRDLYDRHDVPFFRYEQITSDLPEDLFKIFAKYLPHCCV